MVKLKPGMIAEIVLAGEATEHVITVRTTVYEITERKLIVPQTSPPLPADNRGKPLLVTYLVKERDTYVRYGFRAAVTKFFGDYQIGTQRMPVVLMEINSPPRIYNMRLSYRIKPLPNSGLAISLLGVRVQIVDISVSGVRITTGQRLAVRPQGIVKVTLTVDDNKLIMDGQVIRVWSAAAADRIGDRQFVTLRFLNRHNERDLLLGGKILQLERKMLAYGRSS